MNFVIQFMFVLNFVMISIECAGRNPTTMKPTQTEGILKLNECLTEYKSLESPNKCFKLTISDSGNIKLVLTRYWKTLWSSETYYRYNAKLCLSETGKFAAKNRYGDEYWSATDENLTATYVAVQDDGNLVLYDSYDYEIWSTNTTSEC